MNKKRELGEDKRHDLSLLLGVQLPQKWFRVLKLRWHLVPGLTQEQIAAQLGLSRARVHDLESQGVRTLRALFHAGCRTSFLRQCGEQLPWCRIDSLALTHRTYSTLRHIGKINTIAELLDRTPGDLLAMKNFGPKMLISVRDALGRLGLALRGDCHGTTRGGRQR